MAIATQVVPVLAGTSPTFTTPATYETVEIGMMLIVKNGSGASINVTMVTPDLLPTGDAYPDKVYAVAAGAERWIPVLNDYRQAGGLATVTFSAVTSVTVAAINRV
jgi:hypothetical protein